MKPIQTAVVAIALLALPLAADPLFKLYDCKGQESACASLFPGEAAGWDGPFVMDNRVVVNGIDLGPARAPGDPSYWGIYYREPWVIGWEFCCDGDGDGHLVKWSLENGTASLIHTGITARDPDVTDINSKGQVVGGDGYLARPYYDGTDLADIFAFTDIPAHLMNQNPTEFVRAVLRINEDGQALLSSAPAFASGDPNTQLFLLSPINVPFSSDASSRHMPEPSTGLMVGGLLVCLCAGRRWQMRQRPSGERGAVGGGISCKM